MIHIYTYIAIGTIASAILSEILTTSLIDAYQWETIKNELNVETDAEAVTWIRIGIVLFWPITGLSLLIAFIQWLIKTDV